MGWLARVFGIEPALRQLNLQSRAFDRKMEEMMVTQEQIRRLAESISSDARFIMAASESIQEVNEHFRVELQTLKGQYSSLDLSGFEGVAQELDQFARAMGKLTDPNQETGDVDELPGDVEVEEAEEDSGGADADADTDADTAELGADDADDADAESDLAGDSGVWVGPDSSESAPDEAEVTGHDPAELWGDEVSGGDEESASDEETGFSGGADDSESEDSGEGLADSDDDRSE